jgi:hypothetical protein
MTDNTYYTQVPVSLIENLENRIAELEQKWKDRELEEVLDIGRLASKDWVDSEMSRRLRFYKEK